jgi:cell wall-associated NlpC family hydrolase
MVERLDRLAEAPFVYDFEQGPTQVPDEETALREGLNCVSLAHLAIEGLFNHRLPAEMHCYEMFADQERFEDIESLDALQTGDLVWFGWTRSRVPPETFRPEYNDRGYLLNWRESPVNHVAMYTGNQEQGQPLFLHATHITGTSVIWPLSQFANYPRYGRIYRMARLRAEVIAVEDSGQSYQRALVCP